MNAACPVSIWFTMTSNQVCTAKFYVNNDLTFPDMPFGMGYMHALTPVVGQMCNKLPCACDRGPFGY